RPPLVPEGNRLVVLRHDPLDRIANDVDQLRAGYSLVDPGRSVSFDRIARIARRRFSPPGSAAIQIPLVLVALEPHHPPRAAEHVGFFRLRHRDLGMLVEVEMQARRAALGGADDEYVRQT